MGAASISLLLLALSTTSPNDATNLWIVRVSVPLRGEGRCEISHAQLVTDTIDMDLAMSHYTPSLHTNWGGDDEEGFQGIRDTYSGCKVVVTWMAASVTPQEGVEGSLHSAQIDAVALLGAHGRENGDVEDAESFNENSDSSVHLVAVVNCEIPHDRVLTVGSVDGWRT